ncbi:pseudouridine synthase family protein [Tieghemostelium lacteum]|uniref:Pseudouridine synthase family protein n=1 Tax=Tieghemostelium lacteum TaxID=361077 RepID=A0A152A0L4_TIELA|nr:pseudouridine synthase family protein [Tieghemostelium lacteum]|eukprot:KYQ99656.1 pseudouridine synthase family protein [Tieghemostelium lacteum]
MLKVLNSNIYRLVRISTTSRFYSNSSSYKKNYIKNEEVNNSRKRNINNNDSLKHTPNVLINNSNTNIDTIEKQQKQNNDDNEVIENDYIKVNWGLKVNVGEIKLIYGEWGDKFFAIDKPIGFPVQSNLNDSVESLVLFRLREEWSKMKKQLLEDPEIVTREKRFKRKLRNLESLFQQDKPMLYFPSRLDKWTSGILLITLTGSLHAIMSQSMSKWKKKYRLLTDIPKCTLSNQTNELVPLKCCLRSPYLDKGITNNIGTIKSFIGPKLNVSPYFNIEGIDRDQIGEESCTFCKDNKVSYQKQHPFLSPFLLNGSSLEKGKNKFGAREAITEYHLVKLDKQRERALFEVTLKTGRTHQIRVHFSENGYPVVNDPYYNYYFINKLYSSSITTATVDAQDNIEKPNNNNEGEMALQACYLEFINPTTLKCDVIEIAKPLTWDSL